MSSNLNKITVKKTKILVTNESCISGFRSKKEYFNELILKSIIIGASTNCLRQISRASVTRDESMLIQKAQQDFDKIFYKLKNDLSHILENSTPQTHTFH